MKKKRYGIQINDTGDLNAAPGGVTLGDTMAQNEFVILMSQPGDIKEAPLMGAGIADMVARNDTAAMKRQIRDALKLDGMDVSAVEIKDGTLTRLEASYR